MVGILVTGHGHFASGLTSSVELIAGLPENYEKVDFLESYGVDELASELNKAMDRLSHCKSILVFADLAGGSPFKTAVEVGMQRKQRIEVIGGTNLGMIIEISLARRFITDVNDLIKMAVNTGKEQVIHFELVKQDEANDGEGI